MGLTNKHLVKLAEGKTFITTEMVEYADRLEWESSGALEQARAMRPMTSADYMGGAFSNGLYGGCSGGSFLDQAFTGYPCPCCGK